MNPLILLQSSVTGMKEYSELGELGDGEDGRVKEMGRSKYVYLEWEICQGLVRYINSA